MGRKGFLSSKIGDLRKNEDEKKIVSQPTRNHQQKNELKAAFRDVIAVGASALEGKNKKFTKDLMLQQSGRLQKKNLKMPYKMLLSVQKKRKERETREREEMRKVGMDVDKKKAKKKGTTPNRRKGGGKNKQQQHVDGLPGKFHKGMLRLSKSDLAQMKNKKKGGR